MSIEGYMTFLMETRRQVDEVLSLLGLVESGAPGGVKQRSCVILARILQTIEEREIYYDNNRKEVAKRQRAAFIETATQGRLDRQQGGRIDSERRPGDAGPNDRPVSERYTGSESPEDFTDPVDQY